MIFFQPIILAAEFVQHALVIVLCGLLVVECVRCIPTHKWHGIVDLLKTSPKERDTFLLLVAALLSALWLILEYFVDLENPTYHFLVHIPIISAVLIILWRVMKNEPRMRALLIGFFVVAGSHIALDVLHFLFGIHLMWDGVLRAALKTAEALLLYFLVMRYLILRDKQ